MTYEQSTAIQELLRDIRSAQHRTNELLDELLEPVRQQREALKNLADQVFVQYQAIQSGEAELVAPETGPGGSFLGGRIVPIRRTEGVEND
jgi:hypothetical protein